MYLYLLKLNWIFYFYLIKKNCDIKDSKLEESTQPLVLMHYSMTVELIYVILLHFRTTNILV